MLRIRLKRIIPFLCVLFLAVFGLFEIANILPPEECERTALPLCHGFDLINFVGCFPCVFPFLPRIKKEYLKYSMGKGKCEHWCGFFMDLYTVFIKSSMTCLKSSMLRCLLLDGEISSLGKIYQNSLRCPVQRLPCTVHRVGKGWSDRSFNRRTSTGLSRLALAKCKNSRGFERFWWSSLSPPKHFPGHFLLVI